VELIFLILAKFGIRMLRSSDKHGRGGDEMVAMDIFPQRKNQKKQRGGKYKERRGIFSDVGSFHILQRLHARVGEEEKETVKSAPPVSLKTSNLQCSLGGYCGS